MRPIYAFTEHRKYTVTGQVHTTQTQLVNLPEKMLIQTGMLARPGLLLRVEGLALFALSIFLYHSMGESWKALLILFFWPDVSMLGYLAGTRIGAACYNLLHTELFPIALAGTSFIRHWPGWLSFALIWLAHIGFDRLLGYGLKYPTAFKETHLQRVN